MKVQYSNVDSKAAPTKVKVPLRFELGSPDSKSRVLTITPWDRDWRTNQVVLATWDNRVSNRQSTNNTADGLLARAMWVRERRASIRLACRQQAWWRNGSASDSRSEGCVFESRRGHKLFSLINFFEKKMFASNED